MLQEDVYLSSNSPTTLSAPATPRPAQPPIMTMIPVRNGTTMMTSPPPPPSFPYPEDTSQSYCEFIYHTGFQQGMVVVFMLKSWMALCSFHSP